MTITLDRLTRPETLSEITHGLTGHRWSEYDSLNGGDPVPLVGSEYSWSAVRPLLRGEADLFIIDATSWGEYSGGSSDIQRSNFRALLRDFPESFVVIGSSGHDGMALGLPAGMGIDPSLVEIIEGLAEYPLYDEEDHSELLEEVWTEGWDYRVQDVRADLERMEITFEDSTEVVDNDWIQEHYEAHRNVCHWGPTFDGADTAVMPEGDHERVMAEVVKDYRVVVFNWLMGR
ncbi:hypothetical protein [Kineococcus sp. NPDC059986]|uniref:hypothetical protein n=1 Tax=Kineococcus sp. NPDC059986 TaxID=3155538 RepID=UPI00344BD22E